MRDPKKRAISNACSYMNRCYDLGVTAEELVAESKTRRETACHKTACRKEKRKGKEKLPPAPPIEKRESQEKIPTTATPARAREAVVDLSQPPTLDELLFFAHSRGCNDDVFIRKWFDKMENELFWLHPKTGRFLNHWAAYFMCCYRMRGIESSTTTSVKPRRGVSQTANVHSKEVGRW